MKSKRQIYIQIESKIQSKNTKIIQVYFVSKIKFKYKYYINDFRDICNKSPIDILYLHEIKPDDSYTDSQFKIDDFQ